MNIKKEESRYLQKPVIFVSILVILIISLFYIGFGKISSIIAKTDESKKTEVALNKKISILRNVPAEISGNTTFLEVVMPSKSAVLYGISQIKNEAVRNNLLVSNVKTSPPVPETDSITKISISFDVEGDEKALYTFLSSFSRTLPLMTLDKVKITTSPEIARAVITLVVYSADLPKTIPSVSSSATELTTEEISLLKDLSTYTLPVFVQGERQTTTQSKEDPFN